MPCVVELRDVGFWAQGQRLVSGASFMFSQGKTTAIVGPSGGGKSTLLKLAAGLYVPGEGEVFFRGKALGKMSRQENLAFRREAAFVFQDSALWANMSLYQTLDLPLRLHFPEMQAGERRKKIEEAAAQAGYKRDLDIRPESLSAGEQKLIAFARAVICGPGLLFLDEWTESLDEKAAMRLVAIVRSMKESGVSVILVSHDPRIVRSMCDEVVFVSGGRISASLHVSQIGSEGELGRLMETGAEN